MWERRPGESLTGELQVGGVVQQLLLHAAQRLHDHLLHLLLLAVGDGHEGGEEFALFLTGVLQAAGRDLQVPLHVKGLQEGGQRGQSVDGGGATVGFLTGSTRSGSGARYKNKRAKRTN